jgi:hypothetical protein
MFRTRADVRGQATQTKRGGVPPPQLRRRKNHIVPQGKSRCARCLQFAARLVGGVNVRDLRESQI